MLVGTVNGGERGRCELIRTVAVNESDGVGKKSLDKGFCEA